MSTSGPTKMEEESGDLRKEMREIQHTLQTMQDALKQIMQLLTRNLAMTEKLISSWPPKGTGEILEPVARKASELATPANTGSKAAKVETLLAMRKESGHPLLKRFINIRLGLENLRAEDKLDTEDTDLVLRYVDFLEEIGKKLIEQALSREWFNSVINNILNFLVQFRMAEDRLSFTKAGSLYPPTNMKIQFLCKLADPMANILVEVLSNDPRCDIQTLETLMEIQHRMRTSFFKQLEERAEIRFGPLTQQDLLEKAVLEPVLEISEATRSLLLRYDLIVDGRPSIEGEVLRVEGVFIPTHPKPLAGGKSRLIKVCK